MSSRSEDSAATPTPVSTLEPTGESNGTLNGPGRSIALLRDAGDPDSVLGSALIIDRDGLLLTSSKIVAENAEVVLPDGSVYRPALVSVESSVGLALLAVPHDSLNPVEFGNERPGSGDEIFVLGFDGTPGSLGQMSGEVTGTVEPSGNAGSFRVRGPLYVETDINLVQGFVGGALAGETGMVSGILTEHIDESGERASRAASHWFIRAWMEQREERLQSLDEESAGWERMELPDRWTIPRPDGWGLEVSTDNEDNYRAELTPADPDVSLQLAVSVEPNDYGTNAGEFIQNVFEDRSSARIWSVDAQDGHPLVRATISQEGAMVDVAYLLDETHLIAVSMTSDYHPEEDPNQVDEIRAIFETVIKRIDQG